MRSKTAIGDVYKTSGADFRYLQLVALDSVNLNSDVIGVFAPQEGGVENSLYPKALLFYTHTTVADGLKKHLWEKLGNYDVALDLAALKFKNYFGKEHEEVVLATGDPAIAPPLPYPHWTTWTPLDKEWHYVNEKEGAALSAEDGRIVPASDVIYRIKHGRSDFKSDWPSQ